MTWMEAAMLMSGALFVVLGLMALVNVPKVYVEARNSSRQALRATGEVIRLTEEPATGPDAVGPTLHPVVRFEDQHGREHTFQARYGSIGSKWAIGDPIEVAYPPSKPGEAIVDNLFMNYHSVLVALVVGFALFGLGSGLVLVALFGQ